MHCFLVPFLSFAAPKCSVFLFFFDQFQNLEHILTFASNPNMARFSLIVEQILTFASNPNTVREVKSRLQISNKSRDDLLRY